jgi:uncharacterized protein (TIGR01244 family)
MKYVLTLLAAGGLVLAGTGAPSIANFHQVDSNICRGGQPKAAEFQTLARMGIRTVLDLREETHAPGEEKLVESAGMRYISLPMSRWEAPTDEQIARALAIIEDAANSPVFVHCRRGADRTGTVIACYRVSHDGWQNQRALDEARTFGMSWIERGMRSYVLRYHAPLASLR